MPASSIRPAAMLDAVRPGAPVVIGAEASLIAKTGEQNALVMDTPMGQSSVINFKKGGVWYWQINATASNPPKLIFQRLNPDGSANGAPAMSLDLATNIVDFAVRPTVVGVPMLMDEDLADLRDRVAALETTP